MCSVIIYSFDEWKCGKVIGFGVELGCKVRRGGAVADADRVLNQPFVDCFCRMGHEDTATKIGF